MKRRITLALFLPVLVLGLVAAVPAGSAPSDEAPVGGRDYFFCAAFQIIKYAGMATGRPDAVLAGAIGSGIACAYGW